MDATQAICDSILESDDEEKEEEQGEEEPPLAKLQILTNPHVPEAELSLFLGDNVLGRDHSTCSLVLSAPSVSKQHATISVSVYKGKGSHGENHMEVLVWDMGSMNGTRKGHLKLTPHVRYALFEGDRLLVADIPCQYVPCSENKVSSQSDIRTPNRNVKAKFPGAAGENGGDINLRTEGSLCSLKTPVGGACLTFEKTPSQPQGSLVPESDSDSDSERTARWDKLESDCRKCSPDSSTFLTPASKIVPESDDESPITPSPSTASRSSGCVNLNKETDRDVEGQELDSKKSPAALRSSKKEEHSAFQQESNSKDTVESVEQSSKDVVTGTQLFLSSPESSKSAIPVFNLNSDTEDEEEEKQETETPAEQLSHLKSNQDVRQTAKPDLSNIDSDTDIEEDEDADEAPESKLTSSEDSKPAAAMNNHADVDKDEESNSKSETPNPKMDNSSAAAAAAVVPTCFAADADRGLEILSDSDTDLEDDHPPATSAAVTEPTTSKGTKEASQAESDTDAETDADEDGRGNVEKEPKTDDLRGASDTDVEDYEEVAAAPALLRENTPGSVGPLPQNCSTPVTESGGDVENMETQVFVSPPLGAIRSARSSARPLSLSSCSDSQEDEDLVAAETQSFLIPSPASKADEHRSRGDSFQLQLSDNSHLQCRGDSIAAENTQAFTHENLDETQAYAAKNPANDEQNIEATQFYGEEEELAKCSEETEKLDCADLALEETQAYVTEASSDPAGALDGETESVSLSNPDEVKTHPTPDQAAAAVPEEKGLAEGQFLAETQPMCMSESDQSEEENLLVRAQKRTETLAQLAREQTLLSAFTSSLPETQPLSVDEHHYTSSCDGAVASDDESEVVSRKRKARPLQTDEDDTQQSKNSDFSSIALTQPMTGSDDDDSNSMPGPRKRRARPLPLEDESQSLAGSGVSAADTQPLETHDSEVSDENSIPRLRQRKARPLQQEEEESLQAPPCSETQPVVTSAEEERDGEDSTCVQKENPKPVQTKGEEETQLLANSVTQLVAASEGMLPTQTEDEAKPEEKEQAPTIPEVSVTENLPAVKATAAEAEDEGAMSIPQKRKVKQLHQDDENISALHEVSDCKTSLGAETSIAQEQNSEVGKVSSRGEEGEEASAVPVRQTRRQSKALPSTKEKSVRSKSDNIKHGEEKQPAIQSRGRRTTRQGSVGEILKEEGKETGGKAPEQPAKTDEKDKVSQEKVPARFSRAGRRTAAARAVSQQKEDSTVFNEDDVPAKRTRSRSNSVSSDRSGPSPSAQSRTGRGRGRGGAAKGSVSRSRSGQRTSVTTGPADQSNIPDQGTAVSPSCRATTPNRGRGGRQRGRGARAEAVETTTAPAVGSSCQRSTRSRKLDESSAAVSPPEDEEQGGARRGQQRASKRKESAVFAASGQSKQEEVSQEETPVPKRSVRGRGKKTAKTEHLETVRTPEEMAGEGSSPSVKKDDNKSQQRRPGGRKSVSLEKKKESPESVAAASVASIKQEADVEVTQPHTPRSAANRKRRTCTDSPSLPKTPRSSPGSPAVSGRLRAASQAYKVLFTGMEDEAGERVLSRLGGCMAKGVADMNCLVTDKVRRTVKFLCAVAKGVPVVTADWLEKSGKAGTFLSPAAFLVKDPEQEAKFRFSLEESLRTAGRQPLLQGYEIHVTKSVKPEPVHMRDIISSSGATFLTKMPTSQKPQTVVISCEEDWRLCGPAVSASLPVVTAEFILTGILRQQLDFQTHVLSPPQGDSGRGKRKM